MRYENRSFAAVVAAARVVGREKPGQPRTNIRAAG